VTGPLLTAADAAALLAVSPRWLLAEARERRVPHHKLGRQIRFAPEHVAAILADSLVCPAAREPVAPLTPPVENGGVVVALPQRLHPPARRRRTDSGPPVDLAGGGRR
jgi:excisionase family DNA binding protein